MSRRGPSTLERYRAAWRAAPSTRKALADIALYWAVRIWALIIGCFDIELNLRTARSIGSIWYAIDRKHRNLAIKQLRESFGDRYDDAALRRIARGTFQHFAQLYLVEMVLTPRLINEWTWARYVELGRLGPALRELLRERGAVMVTSHFGNFELLGYVIARLGLPMVAVMRPLDNPLLNELIVGSRQAGGLELLYKKGASETADDLLAGGGTLSFISDQDAGRKGIFVDFFGRKASWYKSIGLLAMRHRVPIIVGYAARVRQGMRYRIDVERIIQPEEWEAQADPLRWVTTEFARAQEDFIRRWPEQYLWFHRRWKTRPKEERAA